MIYLMVYSIQNEYYSTRFFKSGGANHLLGRRGKEVFTLKGEKLEKLEAEAKKEARQRGITKVIGLDKG